MENYLLGQNKVIKWKLIEDLDIESQNSLDEAWTEREVSECWKRLYWCHSHLNTVSHMTTLMSFFAITAAVELQITEEESASEWLIISYVCTTCFLVGITVLVKITSSTILPHIEVVSGSGSSSQVFDSPHDQLFNYIALICFLGHIVSPLLFCLDLILIAWIKFAHFTTQAPIAVTAIIVPVQVFVVFCGNLLLRRIWQYKKEHRTYINFGPTRRYSEIAEMWEEEKGEEDFVREDLSLISYSSNTSYGAVLGRHDCVFTDFKVMVDMH